MTRPLAISWEPGSYHMMTLAQANDPWSVLSQAGLSVLFRQRNAIMLVEALSQTLHNIMF